MDSYEQPKIKKTFAEILHSLRTINDTFHLSVESGPQAGVCISLEGREEIPLGFDANRNISADANEIASRCATLKTHWAGVDLTPLKGITVSVNGEKLKTTRLLQHGDRVEFKQHAKNPHVAMVFHEPISLRILPSLLSGTQLTSKVEPNTDVVEIAPVSVEQDVLVRTVPGRYLGLFSVNDLAVIAVCTAIGTTMIFVALNWLSVSNY